MFKTTFGGLDKLKFILYISFSSFRWQKIRKRCNIGSSFILNVRIKKANKRIHLLQVNTQSPFNSPPKCVTSSAVIHNAVNFCSIAVQDSKKGFPAYKYFSYSIYTLFFPPIFCCVASIFLPFSFHLTAVIQVTTQAH
ncbi:hypothetical protein X975_16703, partial [Stegodyphus mimosarum]